MKLAACFLVIQGLFCFSCLGERAVAQPWATLTNPTASVGNVDTPLPAQNPPLLFDPNDVIAVSSGATATNTFQVPIHVYFELSITVPNLHVTIISSRKQTYLTPGRSITWSNEIVFYDVGANPQQQYLGAITIYGIDPASPQSPVLLIGQSQSVVFKKR